ncbi:MAG TPA: hypothetical protein VNN80_33385 [Polyangiaceae bacterium]|jgi:hypothetical protein|nr:hypothetical protein [Polyangiaceae bacterium]
MRTPTATILPLVFGRGSVPPRAGASQLDACADVVVDESGQLLDVVCLPVNPEEPAIEQDAAEASADDAGPRRDDGDETLRPGRA